MDVVMDDVAVEAVDNLLRRAQIKLGAASVVSLSVGLIVGWTICKKRLEVQYEALVEQEIEEARKFYSALHKRGEFETPEAAAEALLVTDAVDALNSYKGERPVDYRNPPEQVEEDPDLEKAQTVVKTVFIEAKAIAPADVEDFDYESEIKKRSPDEPYVITLSEFTENESGYIQNTLSYFEGDDVLADELSKPIDATDDVVGNDNLVRFGHGSGDTNIVYVRNDKIDLEFEIVRSKGKYTEEVLGFIEHSDRRGPRKFRRGDNE